MFLVFDFVLSGLYFSRSSFFAGRSVFHVLGCLACASDLLLGDGGGGGGGEGEGGGRGGRGREGEGEGRGGRGKGRGIMHSSIVAASPKAAVQAPNLKPQNLQNM